MLYDLHELQRRFWNPFSVWAQATSQMFSNPYSPFAYTPVIAPASGRLRPAASARQALREA